MRFMLCRLAHAAFLMFGASILTFLFASLAPGDYFDEMRLNTQIAPETILALRARYQLDRPLPLRYLRWIDSVIHGDLGYSFSYNSPVRPLLLVRARNTFFLTLVATMLTWGLALPIGARSAEYLGRFPDSLISWTMAALLVIPELALALGLLLFAARSGWFPTGEMVSVDFSSLSPVHKLQDLVLHMTLPLLALVLTALPLLVRHVRAAIADVLDAPFMLAARGHGIPRHRLLYRYALPAAANPLIGALLSGSLLVEVVMSWPGLGPLLVEAILSRDLYLVIGGVLLSTLFLVIGNLIADLLLYWADPRIHADLVAK
jgi:peptide/nickel transport system permease protein